jgi:MYXO-CTERM domain-containing protein
MGSKLGHRVLALGAFAAVTVASAAAHAAVGFCDFSDQGQILGITTNGNAQRVGALINLTDNTGGKNGSAYLTTPIALGPASTIKTHFQFQLYPNQGATGGAGITFTLQNKAVTALGGGGSGLGINGVNNSVSIEFDTAADNADDPNDNLVAVIQDGKTLQHLKSATPPFSLKNGKLTDAWVEYDGITKTLRVFVAQAAAKPALPLLTHVIDVYTAVNAGAHANKVFAGFSGATSNATTNNQDVRYWVLTDDGTDPTDCVKCNVNGDPDCLVVPNTPACQPNGFCGECSATNQTHCTPASGRPVCDTSTGSCVECNSNAQCGGIKPVCDNHVCVACQNDFGGAAPACGLSTRPACQGPAGAGSCTQCSATNESQCALPTPKCVASVGTCGCNNDVECGGAAAGLICVGAVCTPGCRPGAAGNQCPDPANQTCQVVAGDIGKCIVGCVPGDAKCTPPIGVCDPVSNNCVQCTKSADCAGNLLCSAQHTCVECTPADTTRCKVDEKGGACKATGQCGCVFDNDCGVLDSGRVCDDTLKVCTAGCRGLGGNACPKGNHCTSTTIAIGQCVVDTTPDAGADASADGGDGGPDGGSDAGEGADASADGGGSGVDASGPDGSTADANADAAQLADESSIEGGGCSCNTLGTNEGLPLGALAVSALAMAALVRRRRR